MSKDKARQAVLSEYDSWVKKHPDDARMMGGFLFFRYLQTASGQSFTAGFKIGCKIRALAKVQRDFKTGCFSLMAFPKGGHTSLLLRSIYWAHPTCFRRLS